MPTKKQLLIVKRVNQGFFLPLFGTFEWAVHHHRVNMKLITELGFCYTEMLHLKIKVGDCMTPSSQKPAAKQGKLATNLWSKMYSSNFMFLYRAS